MSANFSDLKSYALQSIQPNCRDTASDYFNCVEDKIKQLSTSKFSYKDASEQMNSVYIPECMSSYNIESCLKN